MADDNRLHRHNLVLFFTSITLLVIVAGTVLRPLLVELPAIYTYIGVLNVMVIAAIYLLLRSDVLPDWEVPLLMFSGFAMAIPLILLSGGVNSQFAYLLPIFPFVAALTGSRRITIVTASFAILLVLGLTLFSTHLWDLTGEQVNRGKSLSRSFWLLVSLIAGTYFSLHYQHNNAKLTRRLDAQATHDHLTGLLNRRGLQSRLETALEQATINNQPLSLLLMDIDHFKQFDDHYGHATGDVCLEQVAQCLKQHIRSGDLAARFGGEEFVVILPNTDEHNALSVAESLRQRIGQVQVHAVPLPISVTIGVACQRRGHAQTQQALLQAADQALYRGKESGRNRVELA